MKKQKSYSIDQCVLYKISSKKKLADILNIPLNSLMSLAKSKNNYRIFELPFEQCEFTGKTRNARVVQEPKKLLKAVHARLQKLISRIEAPKYGHAAIKGRSYRSNASEHISSRCLATLDVRKFYPSTRQSLVRNFFADQLCCAPDVADVLTKLCCFFGASKTGSSVGLPTGSPLSPILSLYANKPMFDKLQGYSNDNSLIFTCYVDDITFSGETLPKDIIRKVEEIVYSYGHTIAIEKTKIFRENDTKHVTGVAIKNNKISVPHSRFKKARAIEKIISNVPQEEITKKRTLQRKLSGLLGEAGFLDSRYKPWAARSYADLKKLEYEFSQLYKQVDLK
ncbi:reverse transcriptase family protein [Alcaligenes sp. 1735tsa3]|uniref:reverse transcriptase family protein n=1 Tax=Alcaligenes sp. 1735tsa3 TaxID=2953809 RepID=UPI0020A7770B|nr:reverse transcriptase family protein [Alcaligenes sp. 1735tsa3]USY26828.1 reverse transcriptase family protein [Alcaligenes sp. 1735tsa3]